jgi:hypothetical protein
MVNCPKCNTENQDDAMNCRFCHINLAFAFSHPEEFRLGKTLQGLPSGSTFDKSLPQTVVASNGQPPEHILLFLMVTRPVHIFSWIALIGLSILRILKLPFDEPQLINGNFFQSSVLLLIQIFCGIITANIAKMGGKSLLLWFFNGLIPIGLLFQGVLFVLTFIYRLWDL